MPRFLHGYGFLNWSENFLLPRIDRNGFRPLSILFLGESCDESRKTSTICLDLYERREKLPTIPGEVLLLTAEVDVLDDRLETTACGWGKEEHLWVRTHHIILDDPSTRRFWDRLAAHFREEYESGDGRKLRITKACEDSGGHRTSAVYTFAGRTQGVLALKGGFRE